MPMVLLLSAFGAVLLLPLAVVPVLIYWAIAEHTP